MMADINFVGKRFMSQSDGIRTDLYVDILARLKIAIYGQNR